MLLKVARIVSGLILLVSLLLGGLLWYSRQPLPILTGLTEPKIVNIPWGSSSRAIAQELQRAELISYEFVFVFFVRLLGRERLLKAGNYQFDAPLNWWELIQKLTDGDARQQKLTIVEGWNFDQLKAAMRASTNIRIDVLEQPDSIILRALGAEESHLEGLFFPETYFFATGETDLAILRRAYQLMQEKLQLAWSHRQPGLPYRSPYDMLTLASLVEKETGKPVDRTKIAAVFVNRLRSNMRLQTDPSVIYGLGTRFSGDLRKVDLLADTPYNTYTRSGLPPTPIALPGMAALAAASQPAAVNYLYFVAMGDGGSFFSKDLEGHNQAVKRYQKTPHAARVIQ